jgi:hypothetical protein
VAPCSFRMNRRFGGSIASIFRFFYPEDGGDRSSESRFTRKLHGATSQKTDFFIATAVRTSDLTIYYLFSVTHITRRRRTVDQWITTWKGCERKWLWLNLKYYSGICLECFRKIIKYFRENSRFRGRDFNPRISRYDTGVLPALPRRSVFLFSNKITHSLETSCHKIHSKMLLLQTYP